MEETYLGIDPGKTGGWARITVAGKFHSAGIFSEEQVKCVLGVHHLLACIERVHAFPKQGVASVFTFGENYGFWLGAMHIAEQSYVTVAPVRWRNAVLDSCKMTLRKKPVTDKEYAAARKARKDGVIAFVNRLYPGQNIKHSGMADAICLALYARQYDSRSQL